MPFAGSPALRYSGLKAGAGCTAATAQYIYVKLSADNTCVPCAATTDKPCGVLQAPVQATGDPVEVIYAGETLLQADTTVAFGDSLATSADGQATTAVTAQYITGVVVNVAGATTAGTLITAVINCAAPVLKA